MTLEAVKKYFAKFNLDHRIRVLETSTATVDEAAKAHGVDADQIAKTLSFTLENDPILIVVSGASKIDNRKYKSQFSVKARMLNQDETLKYTGHAFGGVCPFGLKEPVDVYLDISLKKHDEVIPAAGGLNSSIQLTIEELEKYSNYKAWVDVCK